jgi:uncharacterized membrane protein YhdT
MDLLSIIYLIIGIIVCYVYTNKNKEINDKNNESGMVCIYLLILTFVWHLVLIKILYKK